MQLGRKLLIQEEKGSIAGQVLFHEVDESEAIYIVLNGHLRLVQEGKGGSSGVAACLGVLLVLVDCPVEDVIILETLMNEKVPEDLADWLHKSELNYVGNTVLTDQIQHARWIPLWIRE
ncbi:hypothetical protein BKA59DRAFT_455789 [Fusarium tricinctum]|uniref:Cyclic nucleotide-binding domain-containing protein n=1 Tax=Fusarium tricinctum TaxID=61284 RepID=A0A8K0RXV1_9HYPO|nr:hypothetical protein BKA59DRAFT_455789 [Fusarium tricinctum]